MESKIKLFGHPVHPMLIVFPLGLLATGVIFDILYLITGNENLPVASFWMFAAGIIGGLLAAVFGVLDYLTIPKKTRAKKVGYWHGIGNAAIIVVFLIAWLIRRGVPGYVPDALSFILELLATGGALITAWLGGELVYRLGMAVDDGANLDAPSSLTGSASKFSSGKSGK